METFKDNVSILVADVDCTGDGKELCEKLEVKSYPALKYGDPLYLEDYKGGREYEDLVRFVENNLTPSCGPSHYHLCDNEAKAKVKKILSMGLGKIEQEIDRLDYIVQTADARYESSMKRLQAKYSMLEKEKDETIAGAKRKDLGLIKSVRNFLNERIINHDEL